MWYPITPRDKAKSWNKFLDFNTKGLFYVWEFDIYTNHRRKEEKYIGNNQEHGSQLDWVLLAFDSVLVQIVVK